MIFFFVQEKIVKNKIFALHHHVTMVARVSHYLEEILNVNAQKDSKAEHVQKMLKNVIWIIHAEMVEHAGIHLDLISEYYFNFISSFFSIQAKSLM